MPRTSKVLQEVTVILLLIAVTTAVLLPVTLESVLVQTVIGDNIVHRDLAEQMYTTGVLPTPHFAYQALLIGVHLISRNSDWIMSAAAANLIAQLLSVTVVYLGLRGSIAALTLTAQRRWLARLICAALALGLIIVTSPFPLLEWLGIEINPLLLGTITPTTYHNPTILLHRATALALFLFISAYALKGEDSESSRPNSLVLIGLGAAITVTCGISKPNYLLAVLPALILWLGWRWLRKEAAEWRVAVFGVILPGILFLAWQYYFTYLNPTENLAGSSIIFAPFEAVLTISGSLLTEMILPFAVSLIFPAVVYLANWRAARHDRALNFAWLTFIVGASHMYLFAETGWRLTHGNFFWSAYVTLFVLFFASARFALRRWLNYRDQHRRKLDWRTILCLAAFLLHVYSGIRYLDYVPWLTADHEAAFAYSDRL